MHRYAIQALQMCLFVLFCATFSPGVHAQLNVVNIATETMAVKKVRLSNAYRNKNEESFERQYEIPAVQDPYGGETRTFRDGDVTVKGAFFDPTKLSPKFNGDYYTLTAPAQTERRLEQTFDWGTFAMSYTPRSDRLDLVVEITNTGKDVIEQVSAELLTLKLTTGAKPEVMTSEPDWAISKANIGEPLMLKVASPRGILVVASPNPGGPLRYILAPSNEKDTFVLTVTTGDANGGREIYDGIWDCRPMAPGASDRYELSLRFGAGNTDPLSLVRDIGQQYSVMHPFKLDWPDRRPIGAIHFADNRATPANPRGWKHAVPLPNDWDVAKDKENGYKQFKEIMQKSADNIIRMARNLGLQGIIVWQVEGEQFPPCVYYGEPRLLPYAAPEMDAAIDEFFTRIRNAGLRPGICIRPQLFTPRDDKDNRVLWKDMRKLQARNWVNPAAEGDAYDPKYDTLFEKREAQSAVERLDAKISYAYKRWGCTLFYIDTNHLWRPRDRAKQDGGWEERMLSSEVFEELHRRHPDVLLIPEHEYLRYWSCTAPYRQPPNWGSLTPREVRNVYPGAFSVLSVTPDAEVVAKNQEAFLNGIADGDILLVPGWYGGEATAPFYRRAAERAPWKVTVKADGAFLLQQQRDGKVVDASTIAPIDPSALRRALALRLQQDTVRARNVWVVYEPTVTPQQLTAALNAIGEANGIIMWTSQI